eukprot:NODE_3756_length_922_cov_38.329897_g3454_i0.p2 GENE.NODE_3756_length_922_cov_38.329897_g3454_i0~~NODE_3756_length_922_cov_38.329897_g3454_i0.p2  ORF type:complete len:141 (+),score=36.22 NODE_3756_length_922_cov_38.329897_g3454_i0:335-757(+)
MLCCLLLRSLTFRLFFLFCVCKTTERVHGKDLTCVDFAEVAGHVPQQVIEKYFESLLTSSFEHIQQRTRDLVYEGYTASQVLSQIHQMLLSTGEDKLDSLKKARMAIKLSETEKRLQDGADELLQLLDFAAFTVQVTQQQ